jgi:ADP-ribosylglycohydrolase
MTAERDRATGCLEGLALGDALGMPTQSFSPDQIEQRYGELSDLVDAADDQPIAPRMGAGSVTDDTEQALLLARLLIDGGGHVDAVALADALIEWEDSMRARGSLDLLGPSTRGAIDQLRAGAPIGSTGAAGTTNGAAMRVAPVGIAVPLSDPETLMDVVRESCLLSHDTVQGIESAGLVAAAVSAGVGGASPREAVRRAISLVEDAPGRGHWTAHASVTARTRSALRGAEGRSDEELFAFIRSDVGTSLEATESIPAAFALVWHYADAPFAALLAAARMGGDTDTMGAIAGAILGASTGATGFPRDKVSLVRRVSRMPIDEVVPGLLNLRDNH